MDQSDTVRKQFIFSNISSFFFFAPERKPQGSSENRTVLTGWQYSLPSCLWSRHCHRAAAWLRGGEMFPLQLRMSRHLPVSRVRQMWTKFPNDRWELNCGQLLPLTSLQTFFILDNSYFTRTVLLLKFPLKKKSYSHGISRILLIPSYQLSQVFIWQVLCFLAGGGGPSCLEHTLWDSCWQNL